MQSGLSHTYPPESLDAYGTSPKHIPVYALCSQTRPSRHALAHVVVILKLHLYNPQTTNGGIACLKFYAYICQYK